MHSFLQDKFFQCGKIARRNRPEEHESICYSKHSGYKEGSVLLDQSPSGLFPSRIDSEDHRCSPDVEAHRGYSHIHCSGYLLIHSLSTLLQSVIACSIVSCCSGRPLFHGEGRMCRS